MPPNRLKPGEKPSSPGEYIEINPNTNRPPRNPRTVTIEPGDSPMPPTQRPGIEWQPTWQPVKPVRQKP